MRITIVAAAFVAAASVVPAAAEQPLDQAVVPGVRLGFTFGAPGAMPFQLALQLQHRGIWTQPSPGERDRAPLSLDLVRLHGDTAVRSAYVLGHDVLATRRAANQEGEETGGSNWVWWVVGGVAVTAALATGLESEDDSYGNNDGPGPGNPGQGCNLLGVNNGEAYVSQGCEEDLGIPDIPP